MIGDKQLDWLPEHGAAEIRDRHPRHFHRAGPRQVGVGAGLVVHHPDCEVVGGAHALSRGGEGQEKAKGENPTNHGGTPYRDHFSERRGA
jgi:hypothetical protein